MTPILRANQEEISQAAAAARRDNDFVYHERLPDPKSLETILAQPIAKPIPVSFPLTPDFRGQITRDDCVSSLIILFLLDLFASLVPIALNNALNTFNAKRAEIMNIEVTRLREATNVLNS